MWPFRSRQEKPYRDGQLAKALVLIAHARAAATTSLSVVEQRLPGLSISGGFMHECWEVNFALSCIALAFCDIPNAFPPQEHGNMARAVKAAVDEWDSRFWSGIALILAAIEHQGDRLPDAIGSFFWEVLVSVEGVSPKIKDFALDTTAHRIVGQLMISFSVGFWQGTN